MLPGRDGFDVAARSGSGASQTPILMLTARGQVVDRVVGLKLGADDYLTKPFEMHRAAGAHRGAAAPGAGDVRRASRRTLSVRRRSVDVRKAEVTARRRSRWSSRPRSSSCSATSSSTAAPRSRATSCCTEVWGYHATPSTRTVDVHVAWLRQKLEPNPRVPRYILTVHGLGYKFTG